MKILRASALAFALLVPVAAIAATHGSREAPCCATQLLLRTAARSARSHLHA